MRGWLREELLALVDPSMDRSIVSSRVDGRPACVLVVGVNGTGKTTTVGKLARVLVAEDKDVVLGAADTFRAAAADQLQTWGERVGVPTIRSDRDGADPAAVAFDAVKAAAELEADVVLIDTAGRLQNKVGLMDELGKVKRVIEKQSPVDEVLLVLDATTGQNGMRQAEVFSAGRRHHRHRAHQARRHRQGRHRRGRAARARACPSSWSGSARGRTTWPPSTPRPSSTPSSTEPSSPYRPSLGATILTNLIPSTNRSLERRPTRLSLRAHGIPPLHRSRPGRPRVVAPDSCCCSGAHREF